MDSPFDGGERELLRTYGETLLQVGRGLIALAGGRIAPPPPPPEGPGPGYTFTRFGRTETLSPKQSRFVESLFDARAGDFRSRTSIEAVMGHVYGRDDRERALEALQARVNARAGKWGVQFSHDGTGVIAIRTGPPAK